MQHSIHPEALLQVWELETDTSAVERALLLLSAAYSITDVNSIAQWNISRRDTYLFWLREQLFGPVFLNSASCPQCKEKVEWNMNISDLPIPTKFPTPEQPEFKVEIEGYQIRFRLPTSWDLMNGNSEDLISICVLGAKKEEIVFLYKDLPLSIQTAFEEQIEKVDPLSNLTMSMVCPVCQHEWELIFDIISYLWFEIDNWARHLLQDVYTLARSFGWREQDILNMSAIRRQFYLQMLRS